jgi:glycosidase
MNTTLALSHPVVQRLRARFARLYGEAAAELCAIRAAMLVGRYGMPAYVGEGSSTDPRWSEKTAVLIAYPNHVTDEHSAPLAVFVALASRRFVELFDTVHLLPFFPSSSDDGFSVIHYRLIDPAYGTWDDIRRLGQKFRLVFDLVLNHVSAHSGWFRDFQLGIAPARHYFIERQPIADYSDVVRPRPTPLFSNVRLKNGKTTEVWTTFSADQVDLNYACPDVLFELLDIALFYASMGASILRLDAVAYLWKEPGTRCIHAAQTHELVKIFHDVLAMTGAGTLLLTETNVPHAENVSYFGAGDEAHMIYQFSLPPLIMLAATSGRASHLTKWALELSDPPAGCTYLNFTASHDGIGLRPLEGVVPPSEIQKLVDAARERSGLVSTRQTKEGVEVPYELNITWFDAVVDPALPDDLQVACYLATQSVPLVMKGVPAVYFNSLFGARNDYGLVQKTGQARAINRAKWTMSALDRMLGDSHGMSAQIWNGYARMLRARRACSAFHPDGMQRVLVLDDRLFAVERLAPNRAERVMCVTNFSHERVALSSAALARAGVVGLKHDLLTQQPLSLGDWVLAPYEILWAV